MGWGFFDYKDIDMFKMLISFCLSSIKFTGLLLTFYFNYFLDTYFAANL